VDLPQIRNLPEAPHVKAVPIRRTGVHITFDAPILNQANDVLGDFAECMSAVGMHGEHDGWRISLSHCANYQLPPASTQFISSGSKFARPHMYAQAQPLISSNSQRSWIEAAAATLSFRIREKKPVRYKWTGID
jgi:hypothetical protein